MKTYPVVTAKDEARCFQCAGKLTEFNPSGYPEGKVRGYCVACGLWTFFDLARKPVGQVLTEAEERLRTLQADCDACVSWGELKDSAEGIRLLILDALTNAE